MAAKKERSVKVDPKKIKEKELNIYFAPFWRKAFEVQQSMVPPYHGGMRLLCNNTYNSTVRSYSRCHQVHIAKSLT